MNKALRNKFGRRIRQLRKEKGWSQEQFAEKVGFHRTYIGAIERGEQSVSLDTIDLFAKSLEITTDKLLKNI